MRNSLPLATLVGTLALMGCRNTDQPTNEQSKPAADKDTSTSQPASPSGSAAAQTDKNGVSPADQAKKEPPAVPATASHLITKSHTTTLLAKKMIAEGKLPSELKAATFGAGCFWGVESTFRKQPGVLATSVGYSGGRTASPTYQQVCASGTGHAEVVDVVFDPATISYEKLLEIFFANHNPTQVNRQGPDVGDQYRTVIFFHDDSQKMAAEKAKADLAQSGKWVQPIATQIVKYEKFWPGEEYHQTYLEKRGLDVCH